MHRIIAVTLRATPVIAGARQRHCGLDPQSRHPATALRVRCASSNVGKARLLPEQWLLIEWLADQAEPEKYYLSTLPETAAINDLLAAAHMRWRIERDYQDLKQDLGLGHYGRHRSEPINSNISNTTKYHCTQITRT